MRYLMMSMHQFRSAMAQARAEEQRERENMCGRDRAPKGWWCPRDKNHEGPCAAWPTIWTRIKMELGIR